jgi:hypothetical protein
MNLTDKDAQQLNAMAGLMSWEPTWAFRQYINCKHKLIALFCGNQAMKTSSTAYQYVLRVLGEHPVPDKNVLYFECKSRYCKNGHQVTEIPKNKRCPECDEKISKFSGHKYSIKTRPENNVCTECNERITIHQRGSRVFRFASEVSPNESGGTGTEGSSAETRNTQYPEFKKWLPSFLIKKDITARINNLVLHDPKAGHVFGENEDGTPMVYNGGDIVVEFVSYNMSAQATAGVQRMSIWEDEEAPYEFHSEQGPRLLAENGDLLITLTPANFITWTYDEVFEKAAIFYRSKAICDFLSTGSDKVAQIEKTDSDHDIAVIQAATDDNPTLDSEVIEKMFMNESDPDRIAIRRYGIFRQVSGRIFKDFEYPVHVIDDDTFPEGVPRKWIHGRGIDYHAQTPWANGSMALSPENEAFIYDELTISPEKFTTKEICQEIASMGKDYEYVVNLIDPYAISVKKDSISVLDDINREFYELNREGIGRGGYWQAWDTKGEKGRDEIRMRLKNAKTVGKPFNNKVLKNGQEVTLPTLWVLRRCKTTAQCLKQWRWDEWAKVTDRSSKDAKNTPQQKFSHTNMVWEALFKHQAFKARKYHRRAPAREYSYFQGRR